MCHIYKEGQQLTKEVKHELGVTLRIMMHVVRFFAGMDAEYQM